VSLSRRRFVATCGEGALWCRARWRAPVLRALLPARETASARGRQPLAAVDLIRVNEAILNAAGTLPAAELRSLDAIHLVTARQRGSDLGQVITYDERMAGAARLLSLRVATPR
jgi:uncharacterized protein